MGASPPIRVEVVRLTFLATLGFLALRFKASFQALGSQGCHV